MSRDSQFSKTNLGGLDAVSGELFLLASLLPIPLAPLLARLARGNRSLKQALDGFVAVALGGIVVLHIWPHAYLAAGPLALVAGLAGLALPFLLHGHVGGHSKDPSGVIWFVLLGLVLHSVLDGLALSNPMQEAEHHDALHGLGSHAAEALAGAPGHRAELLALAVVLHRFPVVLGIWWIARPELGRKAAWGLLATIAGATLAGFFWASQALTDLSSPWLLALQALIAGMLLHVIFAHEHGKTHHEGHVHGGGRSHEEHGHGDEAHPHPRASRAFAPAPGPSRYWASALGGAAGIALMLWLGRIQPPERLFPEEPTAGAAFLALATGLAPALLLAFLTWGLLRALWPSAWRRLRPGASVGSLPPGVSWLEELQPTALFLSIAVLGAGMTVARLLGSALVLTAAVLCVRRAPDRERPPGQAEGPAPASRPRSFSRKLAEGAMDGVEQTLPGILLGIGAVALMEPVFELGGLSALPTAVRALLWAALGMALALPPAASGIIAAGLLHKGLSPAWALAFLIAGGVGRGLRHLVSANRLREGLLLAAAGTVVAVAAGALGGGLVGEAPLLASHAEGPSPPLASPSLANRVVLLGLGALLALAWVRRGLMGLLRAGP